MTHVSGSPSLRLLDRYVHAFRKLYLPQLGNQLRGRRRDSNHAGVNPLRDLLAKSFGPYGQRGCQGRMRMPVPDELNNFARRPVDDFLIVRREFDSKMAGHCWQTRIGQRWNGVGWPHSKRTETGE